MKKLESLFTILLIPLDLTMIFLAFWLAFNLRGALHSFYSNNPIIDYLKFIFALSPLWVIFFAISGLYDPKSNIRFANEIKKIFLAVSASVATVLALGYFLPNQLLNIDIPDPIFPAKSIPLYGWSFTFIFVSFGRFLITKIKRIWGLGEKLLIIGPKNNIMKIKKELDFIDEQLSIVATVGNYKIPGIKNYKNWGKFCENTNEKSIDTVIIADYSLSTEEKLEIKRFSDKNFWSVKIVPESIELSSIKATLSSLGTIPLIELNRTPLLGWGLIYKRMFDVIFSLIAIVLTLPLSIFIGFLIMSSSPGPIFYMHERIGLKGRRFMIYKFRTMHINSENLLVSVLKNPQRKIEWQKNYKLKDDPRVTKIGKFLRTTSLDELPQFINVLMGKMSLVGPRPISQKELRKYKNNQNLLLSIKPGLTGLWQVSGRSDVSYNERISLDIYYIENWSPFLDISILLRTIPRLQKGAY